MIASRSDEQIGSLGGDQMSPTAINDAGAIVGFS